MRRIVVRGSSGSGKTTVARDLARRLGAPHVELDALYHQPDWQPLAPVPFRAAVSAATVGDTWVVDGNHREVQGVLQSRADTVVWLDLPRALVMRRLLLRTLGRGLLRRPLWNGNRESALSVLRRDPERNVVLWAWQNFDQRHDDAVAAEHDPALTHARVVVLRTPEEVDDFLTTVPDRRSRGP